LAKYAQCTSKLPQRIFFWSFAQAQREALSTARGIAAEIPQALEEG
jgi:hypothetical protein